MAATRVTALHRLEPRARRALRPELVVAPVQVQVVVEQDPPEHQPEGRVDGIDRELAPTERLPVPDLGPDVQRELHLADRLGHRDELGALAARPCEHVVEGRGRDVPPPLADAAHLLGGVRRDRHLDLQATLREQAASARQRDDRAAPEADEPQRAWSGGHDFLPR